MRRLPPHEASISRRELLWRVGGGFGGVALTHLLSEQGLFAAENSSESKGVLQALRHAPKAKRVVQLFMAGAASHIDLFDHKPALERHHGEPSDFAEKVEAFQDGLGPWMKPPWPFEP